MVKKIVQFLSPELMKYYMKLLDDATNIMNKTAYKDL